MLRLFMYGLAVNLFLLLSIFYFLSSFLLSQQLFILKSPPFCVTSCIFSLFKFLSFQLTFFLLSLVANVNAFFPFSLVYSCNISGYQYKRIYHHSVVRPCCITNKYTDKVKLYFISKLMIFLYSN